MTRIRKIRIIHCEAFGGPFENLVDGSIHEIIKPPAGSKNYPKGVWVMGVGEPVKVLNREFIEIKP